MKTIKIKTKTGLELSIKENVTDDMELIDDLMDVYSGRSADVRNTVIKMLGEKQQKALYDHCRTKEGIVSAQKVMLEIEDIFTKATNKVKTLKKSQASQ